MKFNVKKSQEEIERALTDQTASPLAGVYDIEELEKRSLITTPKDVPFFNKFRGSATRSINRTYEWVEVAVQSNLALVKYNGYTPPSDVQGTAARGTNRLMAAATVARVGAFAQALDMVDGNAMNIETQQKYIDLLRGIEYFIWQGNDSNSDETDGIVQRVTTSVANGGGALVESVLQSAIVQAIVDGGQPDTIFCSPIVAQRIANYTLSKVQQLDPNAAKNGVGTGAFTYLTPFGYTCEVIPVRSTFLPTGTVYVMDSSKCGLRYAGNSILGSEGLDETNHGMAMIMYSFFGVEIKAPTLYHRVITGVAETL